MSPRYRHATSWVLGILIVGAFATRVTIDVLESSATIDEPEYITAGYSYLATGQLRLERWHPPLAFLLAGLAVRARYDLPFEPPADAWHKAESRAIARELLYADGRDAAGILHTARLPSLVLGIVLVLALGAWAAALWGPRAGWFALALGACDPTLIAHAALATPDIGVTTFMVLTMAATWRYLRRPSVARWIAICACACLALATKHVAFLLVPLVAAALVDAVARRSDERRRPIARAVGATAAAIALVGIALALAGADVLGALGAVTSGIRAQLWHLDHLPLAYLRGEVRRGGWWDYYLVALALKVPVGTLALAAISAIRWRHGVALTRATALLVVAPVVIVIGVISWTRVDLGVRLVLPAIPFILLLAARAATLPGRRWVWITGVALAATVASSLASTTRELAYFNEAAAALGGGERWLTDSNLDWGQDLDRLAHYLEDIDAPPVYLAYYGGGSPTHQRIRHATLPTAASFPPTADVIGDRSESEAPCRAARQLVAISRFRQQGVIEQVPNQYDWLTPLTPLAEIGSSIRVYDVTRDAESHARLAVVFGVDTPAGACERARAIALDPQLAPRFSHTR